MFIKKTPLAGYRRPEWAPEARQERPQSAAVPPPASISLGHPRVADVSKLCRLWSKEVAPRIRSDLEIC